jgi:hypothetical protein
VKMTVAQIRAAVAEEIATAIEQSVPEPSGCDRSPCPECCRYDQARLDAATARRTGASRERP